MSTSTLTTPAVPVQRNPSTGPKPTDPRARVEVAKSPRPAAKAAREAAELQRKAFVAKRSGRLDGVIIKYGKVERPLDERERGLMMNPVAATATPSVVGEINWLIGRAAAVQPKYTGKKGKRGGPSRN